MRKSFAMAVILRSLLCLFHLLFSSQAVCDFKLQLEPGVDSALTISHPVEEFFPGDSRTWCISSPPDTSISLQCKQFDIPKSTDCEMDALIVSTTQDESSSYCGMEPFEVDTNSNNISISLHSSLKSREGSFSCQIMAKETNTVSTKAIVYQGCDCGYSNKLKIVGGVETGINEFPFMAGIVDRNRGGYVYCGAVIITALFVLTANHCLFNLDSRLTAIVVGEHNYVTGSETSETKLIRVKRFIDYPYYNATRRQYDIALIELASPLTYTPGVGPVCLPFMSRNIDLTSEEVTILGWGTTEFGGPRSKYLQKANVNIYDISYCWWVYQDIEPYTQLCTYRKNTDACQYDSGGPLLWFNSKINRYELVGLVSYGKACGINDPSVNTKVAPFLQWIFDNTQTETYCYKTR